MRHQSLGERDLQELEQRVAQRDQAAFNTLRHAYENIIQLFLASKMHDPRRSRDVTSKVFDQAWKRIDRYPWRDFSFQVWLMRIAREELSGKSDLEPEPVDSHPQGRDEQ